MATDWRSYLAATIRYENITKLKDYMEGKGLNSGNSYKAAFAAETEAYNTSESMEAYDAACSALITNTIPQTSSSDISPEPSTPGTPIGPYPSCHHLANSPITSVYRSSLVALKVITETHNIAPHNPSREIAILKTLSHPNIITLNDTFRDQHSRLVLIFPYIPYTLSSILLAHRQYSPSLPLSLVRSIFRDLFSALVYLHAQGIIHRDIKPSNILLSSPSSPTVTTLIDFGTAYHPLLSPDEPPSSKHIEIGTSCYRTPETLFGHRAYDTTLDLWSTGCILYECLSKPPKQLFESREAHEDGNQLGLILSMFKTLGTPTREQWPEAKGFKVGVFEWYQKFPGRTWEELMPEGGKGRDLISKLVVWEGAWRMSAEEAMKHPFFEDE